MAQEVALPREGGVDRAGGAPLLVGGALGLACFLYLLSLPPTLNKADESYILYEAKRVFQGQAPYRDFFDFLTPGSYYFYALAYAVGGVSITSAKVATALLHTLSVLCTYGLALCVASIGEAVLAGLLVVVICVPVMNIASHHWITTTFGLAAGMVLLAPYWRRSSRARPAAMGALVGLVVCTHQGRGTWLIAGLALAIPCLALAQKKDGSAWRRCFRELAWAAAGGAAVCLPLLGYAVWRSSFAEMWYATYTFVTDNYRRHNVGATPFVGAIGWAKGPFSALLAQYTYLWLLESIPALLAIESVTLLWAILRQGLRAQLVRAALLLLALGGVGGIAYFPGIGHVAFVTPFVLPVLAGMVFRVRTRFVLSQTRPARVAIRAAWVVTLAVLLLKGRTNHQLAWQSNPVLYRTAFGTIAGRSLARDTIGGLREKLQVDEAAPPRMFMYPMDAWIYLALPADNPTRFCLLRRHNSAEQFKEAEEHLDRDPQAFVLVNNFLVRRGDPFVQYVERNFHEIGGVGWYRLYGRNPG